jgi:tetratricopeptide (TPR) repeat protein
MKTRLLIILVCLTGLAWGGVRVATSYSARRHLQAAKDALAEMNLDQAQGEFDQYLQSRPQDSAAHLLAAQTARRRGDLPAFEDHLDAYEKIEGRTAASSLERSLLQAQEGNVAGAEKLFSSPLTDNELLISEALGRGHVMALHLPQAVQYLNKVLEKKPNNYLALFWRARAWEISKQFDPAIADLEKVLAIRPEFDRARLAYADNLNRAGRVREAVAQFELLHRRQPDNEAIVLSCAACWEDLHELNKAQDLVDGLLTQKPNFVPALVEKGRIGLRAGQLGQAEEQLRHAIQLSPRDRDANFVLVLCLEGLGKNDEAAQVRARFKEIQHAATHKAALLRQVVRTPHDPAIRTELGMIYLREGDVTQAVRWFQGALVEDANYQPAKTALVSIEKRGAQ